jgi:2-phospho-L-lactate guanylyltransferase (CobY/MobA/RfbA family)
VSHNHQRAESEANSRIVNGILLHHNIEKQMSDSRGEVAYLMADISDVKEEEIRDLFQSLEELSCEYNAQTSGGNRS